MIDKLFPNKKAGIVVTTLALLLLSVLIEMFFFNYRHWQTVSNKEYRLEAKYSSGLKLNIDGSLLVEDSGNTPIEIDDINDDINTIYVNIARKDVPSNETTAAIKVDINTQDEAMYKISYVNSHYVYSGETRSCYIKLHNGGKLAALRLWPHLEQGASYDIDISLNPVVPIVFSWERVILAWGIMLFILWFRPGSILYKIKYTEIKPGIRIALVAAFFAATFLIFGWANGLNPFYQGEPQDNLKQYQSLAEAMKEGQVSLLYKPSEELQNLSDPYDYQLREDTIGTGGYKFDHAYYNGNYYVYFGVVPEVLFYLPYYLITGMHIHNHTVCLIGLGFVLLAALFLIDELIKKFYKECSVGLWFLLSELFVISSFLVYVAKRPDFYSIPILFGIGFGLSGICCFLKAVNIEKIEPVKIRYIVFGSLCTALVAGCRPHLFLLFALSIIIIGRYFLDRTYLRTANGIKAIVAGAVPMLVIGSLLMIYNYSRFGNPFEFGAFYNLNIYDLRYLGWEWDRMPYGFYQYLLHPLKSISEYPYFIAFRDTSGFMGPVIQEDMYGGLFVMCPFTIMPFAALICSRYYRSDKVTFKLFILTCASLLLGLFIAVFDSLMAGVLARYIVDFAFIFTLSGIFAVIGMFRAAKGKETMLTRALTVFMMCCILFGVIFWICNFMQDAGDYLMNNRKDLYYHYYYLFEITQ